MTTPVPNVSPSVIQEIINGLNAKTVGKREMKVNWNRTFFGGAEKSLTTEDCYSEYLMNVYDASENEDGREINLYLYASGVNTKDKKIIIEDDGPGFKTNDEGDHFLDSFMHYNSDEKAKSDKNFIGTAGVGAKDANANLGKKHTYEWSDGHGEKCTFIVDEDNYTSPTDYEFITEEWDGDSFFRQTITKLRNIDRKLACEIRPRLEERFAGKLKSHPSVKVYTSAPDGKGGSKGSPLEPLDRIVPVKGYDKTFSVSFNGATADVRIGLSDRDKTTTNKSDWGPPWIRLARYGIIHVDTNERAAQKITDMLFTDITKAKLKSTTSMWAGQSVFRNIFITINCDKFQPTQIKNDLNLDNKQTQDLLKEIGSHPEFISIIDRIEQYQRQNLGNRSVTMSANMMENLKKVCNAAGLYIGGTLKSFGFSGEYTLNKAAPSSVRKIRCEDTADEKKKKSYIPKSPESKITSSNTIEGRNFEFNVSFASIDKESRYDLNVIDNTAHLTINDDYEGFIKMCPNFGKIDTAKKEFMLYVIDTFALGLQDLVIKEKMEKNNEKLIHEDWDTLIKMRETAVNKCISSIF